MTFAAAIERLGNEIDLGNITPQELAAILERERIVRALNKFGWNQCAAADAMGVHRNTLTRRMDVLGVEKPVDPPAKRYSLRGAGRPITPKGETAKALGITNRGVVNNGLDRDVSPLVMRIRINNLQRKARRGENQQHQETVRVEKLLAVSERLSALGRLLA